MVLYCQTIMGRVRALVRRSRNARLREIVVDTFRQCNDRARQAERFAIAERSWKRCDG